MSEYRNTEHTSTEEKRRTTNNKKKTLSRQERIRRQRSYLTAGVIALVAIVAMVGVYRRNRVKQEEMQQETVIMAESEWKDDLADTELAWDEAMEDGMLADGEGDSGADTEVADASSVIEGSVNANSAVSDPVQEESAIEDTAVNDMDAMEILSFPETGELGWPMHGDVILNYSMDKSVYFATLDQYKYNPAIIISGDVNTAVCAAASGEVLSVDTTAETGVTVTMDIGDGYTLIYGQLKDVQVEPGEFVQEEEQIGFVSEPTKYYSVEGSNLYFEMQQDGQPVNPLDYMN